MKSTIYSQALVAMTTLTLAATAPSAPTASATISETLQNKQYQITAVDLVTQAYRGALRAQGIYSYQALIISYKRRTTTAKDVVEAAVKANLIEAAAVDDRSYLIVVDAQLRSLENSLGK
jgi:hypothetical protein